MTNEPAMRAAIVAEARSWLGTPYHHCARLKGVGVDCAQLPAAVYHAVGLIPDLQPEYSPQWMMHRDEEQYLSWVHPHAREISRGDLLPGDLVMWKFGRTYSHSAIIIEKPTIIHAVNKANRVELGDMDRDANLNARPALYFTLFGRA
jgi:NlpC/P60 family putative phage cell wall peptidase